MSEKELDAILNEIKNIHPMMIHSSLNLLHQPSLNKRRAIPPIPTSSFPMSRRRLRMMTKPFP